MATKVAGNILGDPIFTVQRFIVYCLVTKASIINHDQNTKTLHHQTLFINLSSNYKFL